MKTKHIFIFFLFFLAGNLLSQNAYERMNGVFEGSKGKYSIKFEVRQDVISVKGEKSPPIFTIHYTRSNTKPIKLENHRANGGNHYSLNDNLILSNDDSKKGREFIIEARFLQGTQSMDDRYEVKSIQFGLSPRKDFETVTLNRIK